MRHRSRLYAALLLLGVASAPPAKALLTFDDGKDQILVRGTYSFGYDTNVFTQKVAHGAISQAFSCDTTYTRRAGVISVTAMAALNSTYYGSLQQENSLDPEISLTLAKGIGRTTGSLSLSANKTDSPDPIANNRAVLWNYNASLNLRYPVIERYYLTNITGFSGTVYTNKALFSDLDNYTDALAINYILDSKVDLNGAYHIGFSNTPDITAIDQGISFGANGTLFPKLSGSINAGYTLRNNSYSHRLGGSNTGDTFASWTANMALNWRFSRTLTFAATASKGFSVSSTDITTDTTSASISADAAIGKRLRTSLGLSYIGTEFLGPNSLGRRDTLWELFGNAGTAITTHIRTNLAFAYMVNYSNLSNASFTRETLTLSFTATY